MHHPKGIPEPEDLWGSYLVPSWTRQEQGWFGIWLWGISSALVFCEQDVINRVNAEIKSVIEKAKSGELSSEQAIEKVRPLNVFSEQEMDIISANAKKHGQMMARFFQVQSDKN